MGRWNCALNQDKLTLYASGDLSAREWRKVEAHLQTCLACRAEVEACRDLLRRAAAPVPMPTAEQWAAFDVRLEQRLDALSSTPTRARHGTFASAALACACVLVTLVWWRAQPHEAGRPNLFGAMSRRERTPCRSQEREDSMSERSATAMEMTPMQASDDIESADIVSASSQERHGVRSLRRGIGKVQRISDVESSSSEERHRVRSLRPHAGKSRRVAHRRVEFGVYKDKAGADAKRPTKPADADSLLSAGFARVDTEFDSVVKRAAIRFEPATPEQVAELSTPTARFLGVFSPPPLPALTTSPPEDSERPAPRPPDFVVVVQPDGSRRVAARVEAAMFPEDASAKGSDG